MNIAELLRTKGFTFLGRIPEENQKAILAYINNPAPTPDDWEAIFCMVINARGKMSRSTIWQAVTAVDPSFPNVAPFPKWRIAAPPFTVARGIRAFLEQNE